MAEPQPSKNDTGKVKPGAEDLLGLRFVSDPQLAPDGRTVAAVVTDIVPGKAANAKTTRAKATRATLAHAKVANAHGTRANGSGAKDGRRSEEAGDEGDGEAADAEPPRYRSRIHFFTLPAAAAAPTAPAAPGAGDPMWPALTGDGGREFTRTEQRDTSPRFSPDGRQLAFLRATAEKEPPQLHAMSLSGGEPLRLTEHEAGVGTFAWLPDGTGLVYVSRGEARDEAAEKGVGRRIQRLRYRGDGKGFLPGGAADLYLVDLRGSSRRLTTTPDEQAFDDPSELSFSPDGKTLYFSRTHDELAFNDFRSNVVALDLQALTTTVLAERVLALESLSPSPDGRYLALTAACRQDDMASAQGLWLLGLGRSGADREPRLLTGDLDVSPAEASDSRYGRHANRPVWLGASELLVNLHRDGASGLARVGLAGEIEQLHGGPAGGRAVTAFAARPDGAAAFVAETPVRPGELWFRSPPGEEARLSALNDSWCARLELRTPQGPFTLTPSGAGVPALAGARAGSPDAGSGSDPLATGEVHYWTLTPAGPRADNAVVLEVHGGPHTAYGNGFVFEFQLLAARGYHVVYGNPRGSSSYGHHFATCMLGGYGSLDADDVLAIGDAAVERLGLDGAPMHLTGGSYGGFMTNWLVGVTDRFRSAVSQRSISNWTSMYGTSDIGPAFVERELCGVPWRDVELLWRQSPLRNAGEVVTPLLLIHSEEDYRCPIEQAEQFFSVIKRHGRSEVELLRFPGEGHELSRSGRPDRRLQRLEAIVGWFEQHA